MKLVVVTILAALSLPAFSQTCDYWVNGKDEFTGEVKKILNNQTVAKTSRYNVIFSLAKINTTRILNIIYFDMGASLKCYTSKSRAILKFESGETMVMEHYGDVNCDRQSIAGAFKIPDTIPAGKITKLRLEFAELNADFDISTSNSGAGSKGIKGYDGTNYLTDFLKCID